jgi:3D (Asp-Asp-Asp) domain-containing protein
LELNPPSFTGGEVTYPTPAGPTYEHVLTYSDLTLQVTKNGQPIAGIFPPLKSDRGSLDSVTTLGDTNASGVVRGDVATRSQPGTSTITSASTTISTAEPAVITWLPAQYSSSFEVTCYSVAHEKYDTSGPMVTMPGLPGKHHKGFISKANMQGTGYTLGGNYIQKRKNPNTKKWYWKRVACPHTASGYCAKKDYTIAVDRSIIPLSSLPGHEIYGEVSISGVGDRVAQDTGGGITGYHIDLYFGPSEDDYNACMNTWGINGSPDHLPHSVTLENYVH